MPSKRYFDNRIEDYSEGKTFAIDYPGIKSEILSKVYECITEQQKAHKGIEGGLYTGTYGNAFTLYHLSKKTRFAEQRGELIKAAGELISVGIKEANSASKSDPKYECSFLSGKAGIYAVGAAIFHNLGDKNAVAECVEQYKNAGSYCSTLKYASFGGDELFVGRAGYLWGALWVNRCLGREAIPDIILEKVCNLIVESGREYSHRNSHQFPLMYHFHNTQYLGAAHGLSSILLALLCCDNYIKTNRNTEALIKDCIDRLLSIQTSNGNFPTCVEAIGLPTNSKNELVHWCHGGPGVLYLLLKYFLMSKDPKYMDAAVKIGEIVWEKGLLKKGPGICHGVGGNGYVFLTLYKVRGCKDAKYLYRANEFAKFLKSEEFKQARTPDNPFSLYEGYAGTLCFLADLMEPEISNFPFMEIL